MMKVAIFLPAAPLNFGEKYAGRRGASELLHSRKAMLEAQPALDRAPLAITLPGAPGGVHLPQFGFIFMAIWRCSPTVKGIWYAP